MFTICPKCTLTLAVTARDLRLGQGYVRCGRCATVFNALVSLSETNEHAHENTQANPVLTLPEESANDASPSENAVLRLTEPAPREPAPEQQVAASAPAPAAADSGAAPELPASGAVAVDLEIEAASSAVRATTHDEEVGQPGTPASSPSPLGVVPHEATGTVETIVLEGEAVTSTEEYVDIATIDHELAAVAHRAFRSDAAPLHQQLSAEPEEITLTSDVDATVPTADKETPAVSATPPAAATDGTASAEEVPLVHAAADEATEVDVAIPAGAVPEGGAPSSVDEALGLFRLRVVRPPRGSHKVLWAVAGSLLVLLFAVQVVHHYRNDLAARPAWYNALTRAYGLLGVKLTPNWDLNSYDVRQLGAATNGNGDNAIRVRISLANRTRDNQPFPILRLSLFDRFGKRVAARDLQPAEYLHTAPAKDQLMGGLQRVDTEVAVLDPGPDASSFELDVCLVGARGLRCASDAALSASRS